MKYKDQQEQAVEDLVQIQTLMGQLGFTMTANRGFYKDYGLADGGVVRITPEFNIGISVDKAYKLTGFKITTVRDIPVYNGHTIDMNNVPSECAGDVNSIISTLMPATRSNMPDSYMINATCSSCGREVSSFFHIKNAYTCLSCMGVPNDAE